MLFSSKRGIHMTYIAYMIYLYEFQVLVTCIGNLTSASPTILSKCPGSRLMTTKGIFRVLRNPTSELLVKLQSKNGWFLMMSDKGAVGGTTDKDSKNTLFKLQTLSPSIKRLKNLKTGHYIAVNKKGAVYGRMDSARETLLRECLEMNFYTTFASAIYESPDHEWFLGIRSSGKIKRASGVSYGRNSVLFQVINVDTNSSEALRQTLKTWQKLKRKIQILQAN